MTLIIIIKLDIVIFVFSIIKLHIQVLLSLILFVPCSPSY